MFILLLPSNGCLFLFLCSGFHPSCHNMNVTHSVLSSSQCFSYGRESGNMFLLKPVHVIAKLAIIMGFLSKWSIFFLCLLMFSISHHLGGTRWDGWTDGLWQLYRVSFKESNGFVAPESVLHDHPSQIQCSQMIEQGLQQKQ